MRWRDKHVNIREITTQLEVEGAFQRSRNVTIKGKPGLRVFFKLMKSGGQELGYWQQESGIAILKRLLVASMACALVWGLQSDESEDRKRSNRRSSA